MKNSDHGIGWVLLVVGLILGTMATIGVGAWQMAEKNTPPPALVADNADARQEVIDAASSSIEKVLSYTPTTTADDVTVTAKLLAGSAQNTYRESMRSTLTIASTNGVTHTATVSKAAVEDLATDKAVVLAFIDETTSSSQNNTKSDAKLAVRIGLTKTDGRWLIETYNRV